MGGLYGLSITVGARNYGEYYGERRYEFGRNLLGIRGIIDNRRGGKLGDRGGTNCGRITLELIGKLRRIRRRRILRGLHGITGRIRWGVFR